VNPACGNYMKAVKGRAMNKIKGRPYFLFYLIVILIFAQFSCKKELQIAVTTAKTNVIFNDIENITGIKFNILQTKSLGYRIRHEFYWIYLPEDVNNKKIEKLANAIIEKLTSKRYSIHTYTLHFFHEDGPTEKRNNLKYLARAHFLPEGNWQKVGRIPVDNYEQYKLIISFIKD
jgi:hypothetical protein